MGLRLPESKRPASPTLARARLCAHLQHLRRDERVEDVVVVPIGFISDHMEVVYDLDTEAKQLCDQMGLNMVRAATVGTHPRFV